MPFTVAELQNIGNAMLDFHMDTGKVWSQTIQEKPLLREMKRVQKSFPGGKDNIVVRVKGAYTTTINGFTHDDQVTYANPANIKEAFYPWKEIHSGIQITLTELKKDGISVVDSANGKSVTNHSQREKTALANLYEDKIEDMAEGTNRGMNLMYWKDGSQDSKQAPGVRSFILDDPTSNTIVGGIDQSIAANAYWRNRASLLLSTGTPSDLVITKKMKSEDRQLRRFGSPKHIRLCGSDFLDALEAEIYSKGEFRQNGWVGSGNIDIGQADAEMRGTKFMYDPTLDDLGLSKYCYVLDLRHIFPDVMEGEDMKKHFPSRPEDKYVLYRAMTWTGGVVCRQRNTSGVYSIA